MMNLIGQQVRILTDETPRYVGLVGVAASSFWGAYGYQFYLIRANGEGIVVRADRLEVIRPAPVPDPAPAPVDPSVAAAERAMKLAEYQAIIERQHEREIALQMISNAHSASQVDRRYYGNSPATDRLAIAMKEGRA